MIPLLFLAACEVTTLSNSWGTAQLYSNCSFGNAVLVSAVDSGVVLRNILLTDQGLLQVFDSFCGGSEGKCTGARTYVLHPAPAKVTAEVTEERIRIGDLDSGHAIEIAKGSVSPLAITGLQGLGDLAVTEHPLRAPTAAELPWGAAISLSRAWDFLVDLGFRVGGPPQAQSARVVHVTGNGLPCKDAKVSDFFVTEAGEIRLLDDGWVSSVLQSACAP